MSPGATVPGAGGYASLSPSHHSKETSDDQRFHLHDTSTAPAASTGILDGVQKSWGLVPNLHRVLAESPAALEAYATLWGIAEKIRFTPQERNIAYISIIYENECRYCMAGHP